ncbi:MAG: hypothetical protein EXR46_10980 [Dehalococcoidia bacterium]|nr:hypothetical protein [Dehalococcoidia bacterium]
MTRNPRIFRRWSGRIVSLLAMLSALLLACGTAAVPTTAPAVPTAAPAAGAVPTQPAATALPKPTAIAPKVTPARDKAVLVTNRETVDLDSFMIGCSNLNEFVCGETANEPLTWIDSTTFEVVPLSTVESWKQVDANTWRFVLRQGVKFHNGEPWNAEAAKFGIDINGNVDIGRPSFRYHGVITGKIIDEFTLDIVCKAACPIFPNSAVFTTFQAPKWYQATPKEVRTRTNVGAGPYKVVEWRPGLDIRLEAFKDYLPNKHVDSQKPSIQNVTQVWRSEGLVRTAMVKTREADWAMDIGLDGRKQVPAFKQSGTTEVFALIVDTIWHPELKKKQVRQALAHAIDCKALMQALYEGIPECIGNISVRGTLGITPRNYAPYEYNPTLSKQLLQQAGYDPKNKIKIYVEANRVYRDVEFLEAVSKFWTDVGVPNELLILEASKHTEMRNSGCGKFGKDALDCPNRQPPAPFAGSSHVYTTATSNEMLDMQPLAFRRMGCFSILSRVCSAELQNKIDTAIATPLGPERKQRMEELGDIAHDEVYFIPFFHNLLVYGLSSDLAWEPLYAPRLRVNTMRFK